MNLQRVVAASRCIDGQLLLRAQRLAGMLHKVKATITTAPQAATATCPHTCSPIENYHQTSKVNARHLYVKQSHYQGPQKAQLCIHPAPLPLPPLQLHFPEEESEADLLADMMAVAPDPAVGLVALLSQALDTAGVPPQQRLTNTLVGACQQPALTIDGTGLDRALLKLETRVG